MISGPYIKPWFFTLTLLIFLPALAIAQTAAPENPEVELPTVSTDQLPTTSGAPSGIVPKIAPKTVPGIVAEPVAEIVPEPVPEPHRGYLIELIVFENTQHIELGKQDNNDYSLPNDVPTNRTNIYPSIPDELYSHMERLQLNTLYQPIAYTSWRQISRPRGDSPRFQLNEITPSLTGTVMVYDNVILLSEIDVEYNPALGTAAVDISVLELPEQNLELEGEGEEKEEETSIYNDTFANIDQDPLSNGMTGQAEDPTLAAEQAPYTGVFFPTPFNTTQSYIYRRVNHESARYLINEKRRVKFEETHYFDHPAFGILMRVIRTEIPVDEYNLSTVEALGIPPFSTVQSVANDLYLYPDPDPIDFLDTNPASPNTELNPTGLTPTQPNPAQPSSTQL